MAGSKMRKQLPNKPLHPAEQYCADVLDGTIVACEWVRLACQRHVSDLKNAHKRGLRFDANDALHVLEFFKYTKHSKGEWAGRMIELEPWQQFALWCVFGWKRADGTRRYRTAYLEVARKNGKSTMLAGVGLYLLDADGEPGAEIYTAATMRDQAKIIHSESERMVKSSPALRRRLRVVKNNIHIKDTASKYEPLGRDSDNLDGLNVHGALIDEFHAHKSRDMLDILETATGSRRQSLVFIITTAGYDRKSPCYQMNEYTKKILQGVVPDDSFWGIIFTLDEGDDWEDETTWIKANPNLGVSKKADGLRDKCAKATEMPSSQNAFLRLELNIWTQSVTKWIPHEHWMKCGKAVDANGLRGGTCYAGLDLSSTTDITAFLLVFPPEGDGDDYHVLCRFFVPEEGMRQRSKRDRVPYDLWVRQGFMIATPGEVVDYDYILEQIKDDADNYDLSEIVFDRWNSSALVSKIQKEDIAKMIEFGQGFSSMSAPTKELEKIVRGEQLAHGNNPVLTWMANNLVVARDAAENLKPDKEKSTERIDGMVALIMALSRATISGDNRSVYHERGILQV